jgi:N-acetylglucosamine-6-phosphate deacetylase
MSSFVLSASRIFDGNVFRAGSVLVEDKHIVGIFRSADAPPPDVVLPPDCLIAPGFVDLQVNGGGAILFNDAMTAEGLLSIADAHARAGTTAILPTLISGTREQMRSALDLLQKPIPGVAGLHLEGPFINNARRGIHPKQSVSVMTDDDVALLMQSSIATLVVTLAPEAVGIARVARLAANGVQVFLGHSDASAEEAAAAFAAGACGTTHLFNAMSQMMSRAPGLVGATLAEADKYGGIIADGHHVHPCAIRAALAAKGSERLFLISDAMATAGSEARSFTFGGQTISLHDGRLTNECGTLAGAHLTMIEAVRFLVDQQICPLGDALRMATSTPAQAIRQEQLGRIAPGALANLVVLDEKMQLLAVWREGRRIIDLPDRFRG